MEENGHWVVLSEKPSLLPETDSWGYPPGKMVEEIETLPPKTPTYITTHELAAQMTLGSSYPSRELLKAIQKCLRTLRKRGAARSVRLGNSTQSGWCITYSEPTEKEETE